MVLAIFGMNSSLGKRNMKVSKEDLLILVNFINEEIKADFMMKKLSGNLVRTISIHETDEGYEIEIPAEIYDMYQYYAHKVIIPTGKGSYASELNDKGSEFIGYDSKGRRKKYSPYNHKEFVDRAIHSAITKWTLMMQTKYKIEGIKEY